MGTEVNTPTGNSWEADWAAAEAKASALEGPGGKTGEEHTNGTQDQEAAGEQRELQRSEVDESEQGDQSEVSSEGSEGLDGEGERREASLQGGTEPLDRAARIARLREDAKALGWEVEANAVSVPDRARFREEKRTFRQKLQAEAEETKRQIESIANEHRDKLARAAKLQEAIEANDLDGVARAIGRDSWNELSDEAFRRQLSPEHKELVQLRLAKREEEARRKEQEAILESQARAREAHMQRQKYEVELSRQIAGLRDKTLAAFADDPTFVQGVMYYQEQEWDGEETISVAEAAQKALVDARALHDKLSKRLGARATITPESDVPSGEAQATEQQGRRTPKNVPQREASDASANAYTNILDEKAWANKWASQLKNSSPQN